MNAGYIPSLAAKAPAVVEQTAAQAGNLTEMASSIFSGLESIAANPNLPLEMIATVVGTVGAASAALASWEEIKKNRGERLARRDAVQAAIDWAGADGSLIAYAQNRKMPYEKALVSATAAINRFIPRSDPRAQALDIAMRLSPEDRAAGAKGFDVALEGFSSAMPRDAGVSHNHAKLARLARSPMEAAADAERAAFGALDRGEASAPQAREACYALMEAAACRAVAHERGELEAPVQSPPRRIMRPDTAR